MSDKRLTRWEKFIRWTGFVGYTRDKAPDEEYVAGKTLWDWFQLLLIPATLTAAALLFNNWASDRERERAERQAGIDRQIAIDDQRETVLQNFNDEMSDLILNKGLGRAKIGSDIRIVARTRTLSTLRGLDGARKGSVLRFLAESQLLERPHPLVDISGADLSGALLRDIDLENAYLVRTILSRADLTNASLQRADLTASELDGALMGGINLSNANLKDASLLGAELGEANLTHANLSLANLNDACLANADLDGAILTKTFFRHAYLYNVSLNRAGTPHSPSDRDSEGFPFYVHFDQSYLGAAHGADTRLAVGVFNGALISNDTKIEGADLSQALRVNLQQAQDAARSSWGYCFSERRLDSRPPL